MIFVYLPRIGCDDMKIEKINENQIRCTLTREDLDSHQIHLSELAYGTEKAKNLFRDMMRQAHNEFGFEADNIPLMIEAIPINSDSIILIITKVEDPEELDTRFSKFAPSSVADSDDGEMQIDGADSIIDIFRKLYEAKVKGEAARKKAEGAVPEETAGGLPQEDASLNLICLYQFPNLDAVIKAAHGLNNYFSGVNTLYQEPRGGDYLLVVHQSSYTPEEFNKVCNILSEFGKARSFSHAGEAHLQEHGQVIIERKALQKLNTL